MAWTCPSCGIENVDETLLRCVCGHETTEENIQELYNADKKLSEINQIEKKVSEFNKIKKKLPIPLFFSLSCIFNVSVIIIIVYIFTGFEGRSGMEGMFDVLLPILVAIPLVGLGLLLNIIGILRRENINALLIANLIFSIIASALSAMLVLPNL